MPRQERRRKTMGEPEANRPCRWYSCCPIRTFTEQGRLERFWVEHYCLVGNRACVRFQMEERGARHPDAMLPNGEIRNDLA
jgi:hypothetical protein